MQGRKDKQLTVTGTSTTRLMIYWLTRANISLVNQTHGPIVLQLLKKTPALYAFLGALFQEPPLTNLLTISNLIKLEKLLDYDTASTLAALRALDNAKKLTPQSFQKIVKKPGTALFTANKLAGIPDEKDKELIKNFIELRKNTRVIAQGNRTKTGSFFKLPPEIQLEIILQASEPASLSEKITHDTMIKAFGTTT